MKKLYIVTRKSGHIAIMLVLIIMMLSIITTAAVALAFSTTQDTTTLSRGERALSIAESGAENAILRLLRDPSYAGEYNLPIGTGDATITVVGNAPYVITSTAVSGDMTREIQVEASIISGELSVVSWQEM